MAVVNDLIHPAGRRFNVVNVSAAYAAKPDDFVGVNSSSAAVAVTLPLTPNDGAAIAVGDGGGAAGTNAITIAASGGDTIDGAASVQLSANGARAMFVYDGTNATWKRVLYQRLLRVVGGYVTIIEGSATAAGAPAASALGAPGIFRTPNLASGSTTVLTAAQQAIASVQVNALAGGAARTISYSATADADAKVRWIENNTDANLTVDDGNGAHASVQIPGAVGAWVRVDATGVVVLPGGVP